MSVFTSSRSEANDVLRDEVGEGSGEGRCVACRERSKILLVSESMSISCAPEDVKNTLNTLSLTF